jgi:Ca2+:H+ antiporter
MSSLSGQSTNRTQGEIAVSFDRIVKLLLIFVPIAIIADFVLHLDPVLIFIFAGLGLIPLADLIGEATEELAVYTGPRIGGLLNATLGNAAELIITIFAIREGLLDLVRASITGSILGNLLLVLGLSLLLGGLKNGLQTFDRRQAGLNATMLMLAVVALMIPSLFSAAVGPDLSAEQIALGSINVEQSQEAGEEIGDETPPAEATEEAVTEETPVVVVPVSEIDPAVLEAELAKERAFSEGVALIIIILYGLSIYYSFRTAEGPHVHDPADVHTARWSVRFAAGILLAATVGTAVMSEILIGAVEPVVQTLGLTEFFLGIIIIPLVGNIAEHLVAVQVAIKNKMELSLAVSLGSSIQIALFVAPALVFISLLFNQTLLLVFNPLELIALFAASIIAALIALDGESNWLEGAMLLAIYLIIGLAFFFLPAVA